MSTVDWRFCANRFKTIKSFQIAVQTRCSGNKRWKPKHLILPCIDTVGIHCGDAYIVLKTSNPKGFTAAALLYKFHNAVCQRLADEHVQLLYLVRISPADPSHGTVKFRAMLKTGYEYDDDIDDNDSDDDDYSR